MAEFPGGPLITQLARQPGRKEARYAHLLGGEAPNEEPVYESIAPRVAGGIDARVSTLENEVRELREQLARIQRELGLA
jgi:uncharacterized protein YceH (UPF0502 family)